MKRSILFVVILTTFLLFGKSQLSCGQILVEDFDYPSGDLLTAHGWAAHSGAGSQPITVNSGGLSFTGYASSGIGNSALADNTGEDDNRVFTAQSTGSVYVGFMVKVTVNSAGYFFHLGTNPFSSSVFRGKVFTDAGNHFGISVGSNTGTFASSTFTIGSTYLLILKYENVTGTSNDKVSLYIFDSSVPSTEPGTATIGPLTDATVSDISPGGIAIRQFSSTQNFLIDGIRVATNWSDLIGAQVTAPATQAYDLTFSNNTGTSLTSSWTNGDGAKRVVIISQNPIITPPSDGTDPTANPVYSGSGQQVVYNDNGSSVTVNGLAPSTTYWFQVFEYNGSGVSTKYCQASGTNNPASQATIFIATAPQVSLVSVSGVTTDAATIGATITSDGGSPILERGTVWSVNTPATINDNKLAEGGTSIGGFSQLRTSLPSGMDIFYAAYATNAIGTTLSEQGSFSTLAIEPSGQASNFTSPSLMHSTITLTWNSNDGTQPADGFLILANTTGTFTAPVDGVVQANDTILSDGSGKVNLIHTVQNYTWTGLLPSTTYYFAIYPYTNSGATIDYKTSPTAPVTSATTTAIPVYSYSWIGADNGSWAVAGNWSPARTAPAPDDVLLFNDGTTKTITEVPTQTVGRIVFSNNTKVTLQSSVAATLTIAGSTGTDLSLPAGCELNISGANAITLTLPSSVTGDISGSMTFSGGAHRLISGTVSGITFNSASIFKAATGFSGNPFGTAAPYNAIVFANGSTYICQAGSNPFGAAAPNSVVLFQQGSLFKVIASISPSFSGRTYGNFLLDAPGATLSPTGTSAVVIQDLTIANGTLNVNVTGTPGHAIKGNISVASGAVLTFSPSTAGTVNLNGTSAQNISSIGTFTTGSFSTLALSNTAGINLAGNLTVNGTLAMTGCLFSLGGGNLQLGPAATVAGTMGVSNMIIATGTGTLRKEFPSGGGSFTFPVGDNTGTAGYSPVTLSFSSGVFASGNYAGVNLVNSPYSGSLSSSSYLNRYWNLISSGITGYTCNATFTYTSPDDIVGTESEIVCARVLPEPVTFYSATNTSLHQLTATGLTALGTFTGSQADRVLTITCFLEGLYQGGGVMAKAQNGSGDQFPGNTADQVTIELHDASPGNYSSIVYTSGPVNLSSSGNVSLSVPQAHSGTYYITLTHRNSILTVSALPVSFSTQQVSYNFSDAVSKAFGNNLKQSPDGTFLLYGGDVNQDGLVDSGDLIDIDNDVTAFATGYLVTDVNGDGLVDSSDMLVVDNNGSAFISAVTP